MEDYYERVAVDLTFLKPDPIYDEEKPYFIESLPPKGVRQTNIQYDRVNTILRNARGHEEDFHLETHAFEWMLHNWPHAIREEGDVDVYMRAMEGVLKQRLNAERVHCYDYTLRQHRPKGTPRGPGLGQKERRPILGAHLDISRNGAIDRLRLHFGAEEVASLDKCHWRVVNIWRPLNGPVLSYPLTICDTRTLTDEDLVPSDIVLPHTLLEAYDLWFNPKQKWYFLDRQKNDEVLLMINYDSERNIRAAHSAFEDPRYPPDAPARHSIELRCMVFYSLNDAETAFSGSAKEHE